MAAPLSQIIWETFYPAFGDNALMFAFLVVGFIFLFIVTRQNLASSLLLGMVAIDGLDRMANDSYVRLLNIVLKVLVLAIIGFAIAQKGRD